MRQHNNIFATTANCKYLVAHCKDDIWLVAPATPQKLFELFVSCLIDAKELQQLQYITIWQRNNNNRNNE